MGAPLVLHDVFAVEFLQVLVQAQGGRPDTFDLNVGDRVMVKLWSKRQTSVGVTRMPDGIELRENDGIYYVVAESSIVGVYAEACDTPGITLHA